MFALFKIGDLAIYKGKGSRLSRRGHTVRVLAETSNQRYVVEALGLSGQLVRCTVLAENLRLAPPGLF